MRFHPFLLSSTGPIVAYCPVVRCSRDQWASLSLPSLSVSSLSLSPFSIYSGNTTIPLLLTFSIYSVCTTIPLLLTYLSLSLHHFIHHPSSLYHRTSVGNFPYLLFLLSLPAHYLRLASFHHVAILYPLSLYHTIYFLSLLSFPSAPLCPPSLSLLRHLLLSLPSSIFLSLHLLSRDGVNAAACPIS